MQKLHRSAVFLVCLVLALAAAAQPPVPQPAEQPAQFTFVVFGDNRPNRPNHPQPDAFKKILGEINALEPAFAVNTGDCIFGSRNGTRLEKQYSDYVETTRSLLKAKVYLAIGNHEIQDSRASQEFFEKQIGALYYSFDYGDSHFIILDSGVVGETHRITGDQLEWLKKDLEKARAARHKFVFLHEPLYPVDGHMGQCLDRYPKDRDALHSLFARNRITAVFAGHEHLFYAQVKNGVRYIITGGGGAPLYPSIYGKGDFHHYIAVSAAGDKVEMKVVKPALHGKPAEEFPIGGKQGGQAKYLQGE